MPLSPWHSVRSSACVIARISDSTASSCSKRRGHTRQQLLHGERFRQCRAAVRTEERPVSLQKVGIPRDHDRRNAQGCRVSTKHLQELPSGFGITPHLEVQDNQVRLSRPDELGPRHRGSCGSPHLLATRASGYGLRDHHRPPRPHDRPSRSRPWGWAGLLTQVLFQHMRGGRVRWRRRDGVPSSWGHAPTTPLRVPMPRCILFAGQA